jgi:hypothetical protein
MLAVKELAFDNVYINYKSNGKVRIKNLRNNPRSTMRCFPLYFQSFITRITGKPLPKEKYKFKSRSPLHHLLTAVFTLISGTVGSALLVRTGLPAMLLLPITWIFIIHGIRKCRSLIMRQCAYDNFLGKKWFDWLLGKAISIIFITKEFNSLKNSLIEEKDCTGYQEVDDADVACLIKVIGLKPGTNTYDLWEVFIFRILSPTYHVRFFLSRILSHLNGTSFFHKIIFLGYLTGLIVVIIVFNLYLEFVLVGIIPLIFLYQISSTIRLMTKYIFPRKPVISNRTILNLKKFAVFSGTKCPPQNISFSLSLIFWLVWGVKMLIFHIPLRLFILPGDCCVNDYRGRYNKEFDWSNYIYNREADIPFANARKLPYYEVWGIDKAIKESLKSLSKACPTSYSQIKTNFDWNLILVAED